MMHQEQFHPWNCEGNPQTRKQALKIFPRLFIRLWVFPLLCDYGHDYENAPPSLWNALTPPRELLVSRSKWQLTHSRWEWKTWFLPRCKNRISIHRRNANDQVNVARARALRNEYHGCDLLMNKTYFQPSNKCGRIWRKTSPIKVPNENAINLLIKF